MCAPPCVPSTICNHLADGSSESSRICASSGRAKASLGRESLSNAHVDNRSRLCSLMVLLARVQLGANACFCYLLFVLLQSSEFCLCECPRQNHASRRGRGRIVSGVLAQYVTSEDVLSKIAPLAKGRTVRVNASFQQLQSSNVRRKRDRGP
jgi:hypothetical protein